MKSFSDCEKLGRLVSVLGLLALGAFSKAPDYYFKENLRLP